mmetsp:Transcript_30044/g.87863  ORF Transcript_30044/g.87863 Transcript_30044/m.87863 type:complete len:394 (-) Transcript_30044:333-1514(-)
MLIAAATRAAVRSRSGVAAVSYLSGGYQPGAATAAAAASVPSGTTSSSSSCLIGIRFDEPSSAASSAWWPACQTPARYFSSVPDNGGEDDSSDETSDDAAATPPESSEADEGDAPEVPEVPTAAEDAPRPAKHAPESDLEHSLRPLEVVNYLDSHIVGQADAKRAVAIAMRNRWRRRQLPQDLMKEVTPRNVLMIGPTGCGKTEVARRMATLSEAPFIKVEATKFTEVGYHGRDVDQIIRDLMDISMTLTKKKQTEKLREEAKGLVEERILDLLTGPSSAGGADAGAGGSSSSGSSSSSSGGVEGVSVEPNLLTGAEIDLPGFSIGMDIDADANTTSSNNSNNGMSIRGGDQAASAGKSSTSSSSSSSSSVSYSLLSPAPSSSALGSALLQAG